MKCVKDGFKEDLWAKLKSTPLSALVRALLEGIEMPLAVFELLEMG